MFLPPISELSLLGVADRGVPNQERVILRPTEPVDLGRFAVLVGFTQDNGLVLPLWDNMFWFGELTVPTPSWIFLFTGPGQFQFSTIPGSQQPAYSFHWGRRITVFNDPKLVPLIVSIAAVATVKPGA
jgi:hypothetical protein